MNKELTSALLLSLYCEVASLKRNTRTKVPSVNMTEGEAINLLGKINDVANSVGFNIEMTFDDGVYVNIVELDGENNE